jgi:hypothetical protein
MSNEPLPIVSDATGGDDDRWFYCNPGRRFRARRAPGGTVLVRKVGDAIFLRTLNGADTDRADTDIDLAIRWFAAAYPNWNPEQITKTARKALKKGGAR